LGGIETGNARQAKAGDEMSFHVTLLNAQESQRPVPAPRSPLSISAEAIKG